MTAAESQWGRRADGVEIGVVAFAEDHPVPGLRGLWHVQVRPRPGTTLAMSGPMSREEAAAEARRLWAGLLPARDA